jgi:hypothetical protein
MDLRELLFVIVLLCGAINTGRYLYTRSQPGCNSTPFRRRSGIVDLKDLHELLFVIVLLLLVFIIDLIVATVVQHNLAREPTVSLKVLRRIPKNVGGVRSMLEQKRAKSM